MAVLLVMGFDPETTEEEIRTELEDLGVPILEVEIQPSEDEGRYMATIKIDTDTTGTKVLAEAINNKMWKGHRLRAEYTLPRE